MGFDLGFWLTVKKYKYVNSELRDFVDKPEQTARSDQPASAVQKPVAQSDLIRDLVLLMIDSSKRARVKSVKSKTRERQRESVCFVQSFFLLAIRPKQVPSGRG